jgi:hypothetical protein
VIINQDRDRVHRDGAQFIGLAKSWCVQGCDPLRSGQFLPGFFRRSFTLWLEDAESMAAVLANEREAGHVGKPVADVDHILQGNPPVVVGDILVDRVGTGAARHLKPFVDLEDVTSLVGERDRVLQEADDAILLGKAATANTAEILGDGAAANDLFEPAADDIGPARIMRRLFQERPPSTCRFHLARVQSEILSDFALHPLDFSQEPPSRKMIGNRIVFDAPQMCHLLLKVRNALQR